MIKYRLGETGNKREARRGEKRRGNERRGERGRESERERD
jgi:hypothetical protein